MKHKVVVGISYGGLSLTRECVKWLKDHGYSEEMVQEYLQDKVPRHDPTLVRCVEEVKNNDGEDLIIPLPLTAASLCLLLQAQLILHEREISFDDDDDIEVLAFSCI